jgi:mono/diheme cytochrome c family protein
VSNTDSVNEVRFEGTGARSGGSTVRGRIAESRISVINPSAKSVMAVHLNKHLDFRLVGDSVPSTDKARSLAQPTAMVTSPDGSVLYTAAFGSGKVAAIPTSGLTGSFQPDAATHIDVAKGPAGLALNADGSRLYVYSRIEQKITVIATASRTVVGTPVVMFNPEADVVQKGRQFLYDAKETSANGSASCASCHVFGDMDHLAWDLGNPDENTVTNKNKYVQSTLDRAPGGINARFHPVKGPMTTQTLRGMKGNGPLHWRGDRMGASPAQVAGKAEPLEDAAFKEFNDSFVSLLGRKEALTADQLQQYTRFAMQMVMPPNPVRALDGSLDANQAAGKKIYNEVNSITDLGSCNNCHTLDPAAGKFGTAGLLSFEGPRFSDNFKVPHLRNMYQKVGMFGNSVDTTSTATGQQVRGFGFGHDGSLDTLDSFFRDDVFKFPAPAAVTRKQVVSFVLAFDTDYAPIVGQQVSWRPGASDAVDARLALLQQQALVTTPRPACDLQARGSSDGKAFSALMQADGSWAMRGGGNKTDSALRAMATASAPITFTCLPPRTGKRTALDSL